MQELYHIINESNKLRDIVYDAKFEPIKPFLIEGFEEDGEYNRKIEVISNFLPCNKYFDNHKILTEPFSNNVLIKHVDFESKGRGGLNFKIERIYTSFLSYSQKGEILIKEQTSAFYQEIKNIIDPNISTYFKDSIMDWLFLSFRTELINARVVFNKTIGKDTSIGVRYEEMENIDELINSINLLPRYQNVYGPIELAVGLLKDGSIKRIDDLQNGIYNSDLIENCTGSILRVLPIQIRMARDKFLLFIEETVDCVNENLTLIDNIETTYNDSIIGDGWTFNFPKLQIPDQISGRNGFIFFDGYIREKYCGEYMKIFENQKGKIIRLSRFPNKKQILNRFLNIYNENIVKLDDIQNIEYKFTNIKGISYYFDFEGNIKFITDRTHNNLIYFNYIGSLISYIIDASGNKYNFYYKSDGSHKLVKIESNLHCVEYSVKEIHSNHNSYILECIRNHNYITSYEYNDVTISETPLFINGKISIPILKKETNPLGGSTVFNYYPPNIAIFSAAFSKSSIATSDSSLTLKTVKNPWHIKNIYRMKNCNQLLIAHKKIEEGIVSDLPWKPYYRKTYSIYKNHVVEYEFRENYGKLKLFKKSTRFILWNNGIEPNIENPLYHIGNIIKQEIFKYNHKNLLTVKTTYNSSPFGQSFSYVLKEKYLYSEDSTIAKIYRLPIEKIIIQEPGGLEIRRLKYYYNGTLPLINEIKGDIKKTRYQYFTPRDQDPGCCGKPTIIKEFKNNSQLFETTKIWYDKYGNIKKIKNALNRITSYEYAPNNGLEEVFIWKIIEEERND